LGTHVDDIEAYVLKAAGNIFRWRVWGKMTDYCLDRVFEFGQKVKEWRLFFSITRHFFCYDTGSILCISEVLPFDMFF
jgi:hypothetical protein